MLDLPNTYAVAYLPTLLNETNGTGNDIDSYRWAQ